MKEIIIVDIGIGNVRSLERAIFKSGYIPVVVNDVNTVNINRVDGVVLPGVGNAEAFLSHMKDSSVDKFISDFSKTGRPLIGICLGMQILGGRLDEADGNEGLKILPFDVVINEQAGLSCSHTCWEEIRFFNIAGRVYYNHRYSCVASSQTKNAEIRFISGSKAISYINIDNIYGLQFHPEKSQITGLNIISEIIG